MSSGYVSEYSDPVILYVIISWFALVAFIAVTIAVIIILVKKIIIKFDEKSNKK